MFSVKDIQGYIGFSMGKIKAGAESFGFKEIDAKTRFSKAQFHIILIENGFIFVKKNSKELLIKAKSRREFYKDGWELNHDTF